MAAHRLVRIASDATLLAQCVARSLDAAIVRERCRASTHRVIKLLRLPWLLKRLAIHPTQLFDADVRLVHVVRHPGDILRSRAAASWLLIHNATLEAEADSICMHMVTNAVVLQNAYPDQHVTVKYEDFVADFEPTLLRLAAFLGIDMTQDMWSRARQIQQHRHAAVPQTDFAQLSHSRAEMHAIVWRVRTCAAFMARFGYRPGTDEL